MLSVTPLLWDHPALAEPENDVRDDVEYLLRRAEEESVATIRSLDPRVAERHAGLAKLYSIKLLAMIEWLTAEKTFEAQAVAPA